MKSSLLFLRHGLFSALLTGATGIVCAQDLHFSQSYLHAQFQNPALAGLYTGDWRASAHYRSQWETVPVQFRTLSAAYDTKVIRNGTNMVAAGLMLAQDEAGDASLRWSQIGANVGVTHALNQRQAISAGLGLMFVQRRIDLSGLKFNNQWDGDIYNPDLPSKEILDNQTGVKASLSAGVNWRLQNTLNRTQVQTGITAFHVNRPDIHFKNNQPFSLPVRLGWYGQSTIQNNEVTDYVVFAHYQRMGAASEAFVGGGMRYWLDDETAFQCTAATRIGDALVPAVQVQWRQWTVGVSYDVNISRFDVATQRRGGFELAVVYTSLPVKPIKDLKACPIF
jgi:type IX secretion system PorP/SprF family membrane protein